MNVDFSGFNEGDLLREACEGIATKMRREFCPEHRQHPNVSVVWRTGGYTVDGSFCCDALKERAMRFLQVS